MTKILTPVKGALVKRTNSERVGIIQDVYDQDAKVYWPQIDKQTLAPLENLTSGFSVNTEVLHTPEKSIYRSFGWGIVRAIKEYYGQTMLLVEFLEKEKRLWLPWQHLAWIRSIQHKFSLAQFDAADSAERLRLRLLSWAIRLWNENTGSLATFDIDPLPHQIHLVHHILASGQYNWLIADDVGLGKTIEVGLLLAALRQRGEANRVLLITPAGLTRQWQEEMSGKFGLDDFRIYGDDFAVRDARHWKMYNHVIGSIDRLKNEDHRDMLFQAEPWDLVIVDEAHRLSRRLYGRTYETSQRYGLLHQLRNHTESVLLLTATPHQGREDSFTALLELLHPDRKQDINMLRLNPEILGEMVFRNYKADVTDIDGNFIFHGKTTHQIEVPLSDEAVHFDKKLRSYVRLGYATESRLGGGKARAIGFVMTVYRKLAASSIAAIHDALIRRRDRLRGENERVNIELDDARFQGEEEELLAEHSAATPFFEGEMRLLDELIEDASALRKHDTKLEAFLDELVERVLKRNPNEKILVFTEYLGTLSWLKKAMNDRFGFGRTACISGGMSLEERRQSIDSFTKPGGAQFLLSTEAGGEGINLQQHCHIMVNYDLPWNPMRLVQRTGRLYRYGQKNHVVVFNMQQKNSADDRIIDILYTRLDQVATDLATVQAKEFNESLHDDILGGLADLVEVEDILEASANEQIVRTRERINEALDRAKQAMSKQHELFQHAAGYQIDGIRNAIPITTKHLQAFVGGMCSVVGIEIVEQTQNGLVWHLRLGDEIRQKLGVVRKRWTITFDRMIAARHPDWLPMNVDNWLFSALLEMAGAYDFGGLAAQSPHLPTKGMAAAVLRWQNPRGRRARQELAIIGIRGDSTQLNPGWASDWLLKKQPDVSETVINPSQTRHAAELADKVINQSLASRLSKHLLPEQPQWLAGVWRCETTHRDKQSHPEP